MSTNILILNFSSTRSDEEQNAALAEAAAAQMEAGYKAALEIQTTDDLFIKGYWLCDRGHRFHQAMLHAPSQCSVCGSRIFRWIPGR